MSFALCFFSLNLSISRHFPAAKRRSVVNKNQFSFPAFTLFKIRKAFVKYDFRSCKSFHSPFATQLSSSTNFPGMFVQVRSWEHINDYMKDTMRQGIQCTLIFSFATLNFLIGLVSSFPSFHLLTSFFSQLVLCFSRFMFHFFISIFVHIENCILSFTFERETIKKVKSNYTRKEWTHLVKM